MRAQTRSEIAGLLDAHGISPSHRLGQHFLADPNITRKIVSLSGVGPRDRVVEIGAGTGTLSRALAQTGARVVAYEVDARLRPVLEEVTSGTGVVLRFADVMKIDLGAELDETGWVMVANLPYNVGTPLLIDTLRRVSAVERFVVMMQREVVERFVAAPGSAEYGLPSVVTAIHARATLAFRVPPQVFYPAPRVESAVLIMERKPSPASAERAIEIARAGFGQRRKMLRSSLAGVLSDPVGALEEAGIDPTSRAEALVPEEFLRLARGAE